MTKQDFIDSFADGSKISLMDTILGDIYDKAQENFKDPTRIIKSHLEGIVEEASHDSRLIDVFMKEYQYELECKMGISETLAELDKIRTTIHEQTLNVKPHTEI